VSTLWPTRSLCTAALLSSTLACSPTLPQPSLSLPQDWTGEGELSDAILAVLQRLPSAQFVATTLGTRGSVLIERPAGGAAQQAAAGPSRTLQEVMHALSAQASAPESACERRVLCAV
jgi:hypothetical protein